MQEKFSYITAGMILGLVAVLGLKVVTNHIDLRGMDLSDHTYSQRIASEKIEWKKVK